MIDKTTPSLHTLPVELCYRILDHLDDWTIGTTAHNVCQRLNLIINTYDRYQVWKKISIDGLFSCDRDEIFKATQYYRKLSPQKLDTFMRQFIDIDITRRFVELLSSEQNQIQYDVVRIMLNLAGGSFSQTKCVVDAGAVPHLIQLINSSNEDIQDDALWTLANIAADNSEYRDYVLNEGILTPLLNLFSSDRRENLLPTISWCFGNLCRGENPSVDFNKVAAALPLLNHFFDNRDSEILLNICLVIVNLTRISNEAIQAVIEAGLIPRLIDLLGYKCTNVLSAALRSIGTIVSGTNEQTQAVLDADVLPRLSALLKKSQSQSIKQEICWVLSNITAGTKRQLQAVIDANIFPILIHILRHDNHTIRREAAWAVLNALNTTPEQTKYVIDQGIIPPLCELLNISMTIINNVVFEGLEIILKLGFEETKETNNSNQYVMMIRQCHGLNKIEQLQSHADITIAQKASHILKTYFHIDESAARKETSTSHEFNSTNKDLKPIIDIKIDQQHELD